jgi:hypothetical protein
MRTDSPPAPQMMLKLLRAFRSRGIDAASPRISRQIETLERSFPEHAAELLEELSANPYPRKDVRGKCGQHGRLRDQRDLLGQEEAWMWHAEGLCKVIYKRTDSGPLIVWVHLPGD